MSSSPSPVVDPALLADLTARKAVIDEQLRDLDRQRKRVLLELEFLREECPHPEAYTKSLMGRDTLWRCPLCEKTR